MKKDTIKKEYYKLTKKQEKYSRIKDVIDRTAGVVGTILASPVFLGICIASLLSMKGQKNIENIFSGFIGAFFSLFLAA